MSKKTMNSLSLGLLKIVEEHFVLLQRLDIKSIEMKPHPERWSKKEILGHLIDSAANNHHRFVRIQSKDDLIFDGYDQVYWVEQQGYQDKNWDDILGLWYQYNKHLSYVIGLIPDNVLNRARLIHNLDKIAFKTIPVSQPTTLAYFIQDYIDHLLHHLSQILK